ncbi:MAG: NAD-dependent epimerase/dehydratase family protein [Alphaproteobacteria bacterium]|nr:NAD-dependent epimerase/dehydratase family protein [Alphaproteobacteria bacterium]
MMRCLVTGATGVIGRHAVQALAEAGNEVHAISRRLPTAERSSVTWHQADVLAREDVRRVCVAVQPTHLLHFAWVTEHGRFWNAPENEIWRDATRDLVMAFHDHGGARVVVAGSCAEYDWTRLGDGVCHEEETPIGPHTAYGRAKVETHDWLRTYCEATSMSYAWGRVFLLYGRGEDRKRLIPSVARALAHGRVAECSSGTQVRDIMDARDVGRAFVDIVTSSVRGPINVASGVARTIAELVNLLGDISGRPNLVRMGALPDRADDPPVLLADVQRLCHEVGFVPRFALRESLEEMYREYGHDG